MANTPARAANRLASGLKQFQPILESAASRDVNESDTVTIVADMFSEVFGYDKYSELTSEVAIHGSYCDLAVKADGEIQFLVEIKAIGTELKENQTRQAIDYAAHEGVDWVVLTNGALWKVYTVNFSKPIEPELVFEFDVLALDPKNEEHIDSLFLLSKEGFRKSALSEYRAQREALNRFCLAALMTSAPVVSVIRKELRRLSPDVRIDAEQVRAVLEQEVIKRDTLEGDRAADAHRRVARALAKAARAKDVAAPLDAPPPAEVGSQQAAQEHEGATVLAPTKA